MVNTGSSTSIAGASLFGSGSDFPFFRDSGLQRRRRTPSELYSQSQLVRSTITAVILTDGADCDPPYEGNVCCHSPRD